MLQKGAVQWLWRGVSPGEVHPLNECMRTGPPLGPVLALASLAVCTHEEPRPLGSHCDFPGLCGLEGLLYPLLMKQRENGSVRGGVGCPSRWKYPDSSGYGLNSRQGPAFFPALNPQGHQTVESGRKTQMAKCWASRRSFSNAPST